VEELSSREGGAHFGEFYQRVLCDPIWHVISHTGELIIIDYELLYLCLLYFILYAAVTGCIVCMKASEFHASVRISG